MRPEFNISLKHLLDAIFDAAGDQNLTVTKLSAKAKLSAGTIYKWRKVKRINRGPYLQTVWKLCRAVGFNLHEISLKD